MCQFFTLPLKVWMKCRVTSLISTKWASKSSFLSRWFLLSTFCCGLFYRIFHHCSTISKLRRSTLQGPYSCNSYTGTYMCKFATGMSTIIPNVHSNQDPRVNQVAYHGITDVCKTSLIYISYQKSVGPVNISTHSRALLTAILCQLVTL